jgi:hypothetical protein
MKEQVSHLGIIPPDVQFSSFHNKEFEKNHHQAKIEWILNLRNKISANRGNESVSNITANINWIYGMRCDN